MSARRALLYIRLERVKEIPGVRTYVSVDGGMTDNPRYALYQSEYQIMNAGLATQEKTMRVTLGRALLRERRFNRGKSSGTALGKRGI